VQVIGLWPGTPSQPVRREVLSEVEAEDDTVQVIGLWPGTPSQPVRREVLSEVEAEDDTAWF
ncbi:hypothetical protein, partial [Klebsiella pneumoniae]|uniref:hypothetical protein n=1 Tax=Klebsiella pneumoniae TaxID=573 RepID=UPI0015C4531E